MKQDKKKHQLFFTVITDPHVTYPLGKNTERLSDESIDIFKAAINQATINKPELIIFLGDLFEARHYGLKNLKIVKDIISKIELPYLVVIGNHDIRYKSTKDSYDKSYFFKAFNKQGVKGGDWRFDVKDKLITFISIDTTTAFDSGGSVSDSQLSWLDNELSSIDGSRYVIILAHHPFVVYDEIILQKLPMGIFVVENYKEVQSVLARHQKKIKAVINGHNHVRRLKNVDGIHHICCPSINSWPLMYSEFKMTTQKLCFEYIELADRKLVKKAKRTLLGETSEYAKYLTKAQIKDYFWDEPLVKEVDLL